MDKGELRRYIQSIKRKYSVDERIEMSREVINRLTTHPLYINAKTVLLYHSLPDEVYTHQLIEDCCRSKTVLLPTVVGDDLELHVYTPQCGTSVGLYSIVESNGPLFTQYSQIDLAVIPGMAFDTMRNRLGRGKGYYDRLLPHLTCPKIGICFPFQLVESIPGESHDIKMDEVI